MWGKKLRLLLDHNPDAKLLGLSATPIRYLDNMRNMADELFDGNVVYELSLADAIAQGILPIPKYKSCLYSFDDVNTRISRYEERLKTEKRIKERDRVNKLIEKAKSLIADSPDVKTVLNKNIYDREGHYIIFCRERWFLSVPVSMQFCRSPYIFDSIWRELAKQNTTPSKSIARCVKNEVGLVRLI